jgi:hypothetical protein
MIRLTLHAILILAFLSGGLMPAGLSRCQAKTSCCGCGPSIDTGSCCCGPEAAANAAPAPVRADSQFDWTAMGTERVSAGMDAAPAASTFGRPVLDPDISATPIPLYLSHRAFLI